VLPRRRQPKRLETDSLKRKWPKHRAWVRTHECVVTTSERATACEGITVFAHYRTAANAGTGLKPPDWWGLSCCWGHHAEQHQLGQPGFEAKYGLDLDKIAEEFARNSPDAAMKQEMKRV
jgi:hypothetical protein